MMIVSHDGAAGAEGFDAALSEVQALTGLGGWALLAEAGGEGFAGRLLEGLKRLVAKAIELIRRFVARLAGAAQGAFSKPVGVRVPSASGQAKVQQMVERSLMAAVEAAHRIVSGTPEQAAAAAEAVERDELDHREVRAAAEVEDATVRTPAEWAALRARAAAAKATAGKIEAGLRGLTDAMEGLGRKHRDAGTDEERRVAHARTVALYRVVRVLCELAAVFSSSVNFYMQSAERDGPRARGESAAEAPRGGILLL